jgi:hypothetical protein
VNDALPATHPYREHEELEPILITGTAYERSATVEVSSRELHWKAQKGQLSVSTEDIVIPLVDVNLFFAVVQRKSSRLHWALALAIFTVVYVLTQQNHD